nr:MAG TPA: hypothetical protein [Caudoviricetes sp.]DAT01366.1 MAG TPA: hypothetical protein [Caudoviricetes sp.]
MDDDIFRYQYQSMQTDDQHLRPYLELAYDSLQSGAI